MHADHKRILLRRIVILGQHQPALHARVAIHPVHVAALAPGRVDVAVHVRDLLPRAHRPSPHFWWRRWPLASPPRSPRRPERTRLQAHRHRSPCRSSLRLSSPSTSSALDWPSVVIVVYPAFPSTFAMTARRFVPVHANDDGDALMPGVRLRAAPPDIATSWMSPPVSPASLIRPSMNATDFPSGETCGSAICHFGL